MQKNLIDAQIAHAHDRCNKWAGIGLHNIVGGPALAHAAPFNSRPACPASTRPARCDADRWRVRLYSTVYTLVVQTSLTAGCLARVMSARTTNVQSMQEQRKETYAALQNSTETSHIRTLQWILPQVAYQQLVVSLAYFAIGNWKYKRCSAVNNFNFLGFDQNWLH